VAITPYQRQPLKVLATLAALTVGLAALLLSVATWGTAQLTPKLGLDLEGGTQIVLEPVLVGTSTVSSEQLNQARDIIVQRVDASGVAGAEVTTRAGRNIVVSMPGQPDRETEEAIRRSSQMRFRPVIVAAPGSTEPVPTPSPTGAATDAPGGTAPSASAPAATPATTTPTTAARSGIPQALVAETTPPASGTPAPTTSAPAPTGAATPTDASDPAWVTEEVVQQFTALDCSSPDALEGVVDDPAKPLVTCSDDGLEKFILGPVEVRGDEIKDAVAGYKPLANGQPSTEVEIALSFDATGTKNFAEVTKRLVGLQDPRNRFAVTLDSRVLTAPVAQAAILNGRASITGNFTIESARELADQLKFGALPMSFTLQTREQISPTLGGEQLRMGVIAGIIGLVLVAAYSLFQYRALGLVTVVSIAAAGLLTYLSLTLLGWSHNYRLDMAGVTGLVIAIGVTADSFIVYFERVRDEVREGRPLRAAVESGWKRARRTILVADGVNFLAAVVLYFLASSGVRGFAFTLGLTTLLDILVVFLFTHPVVRLLAETRFFGGGHRWSGLDPERLGATASRYRGRGRFTPAAGAALSQGGSR
jgi:preprotein translocase subunit SecD